MKGFRRSYISILVVINNTYLLVRWILITIMPVNPVTPNRNLCPRGGATIICLRPSWKIEGKKAAFRREGLIREISVAARTIGRRQRNIICMRQNHLLLEPTLSIFLSFVRGDNISNYAAFAKVRVIVFGEVTWPILHFNVSLSFFCTKSGWKND